MTSVAFYAPLKSPDHPNPSGDRTLARNLLAALRHAGFNPELASDLRLLDISGDTQVQAGLMQEAEAALPSIIEQGRRAGWRVWITYHTYYKAPDLIGPKAARALGIPYVLIEATRAKKRLTGPWAGFAQAAEAACDAADVICYFTRRDAEALAASKPAGQKLVHLRPFLARAELPARSDRTGPMLAAGMMRPGDKLASYALIAQALTLLRGDWALDIAGDGKARAEVAQLMAPFGDRVRFLGKLDEDEMAAAYQNSSLFFWPGVNEAIGLVYLEAQAAGLPVLAQDRPGLRDVLAPGVYPDVASGAQGLAARMEHLLKTPTPSGPIRDYIAQTHLLQGAAKTLESCIFPLIGGRHG